MKSIKQQAGFLDFKDLFEGAVSFFGGERRNEQQASTARDVNEFNAEQAALQREFESREAAVSRNFNAREAQKNRIFQGKGQTRVMKYDKILSDTAVRRRMRDMRVGGLNPILAGRYDASSPGAPAVSGGAASSSPAKGASASGVQATIEDSIGKGVSSARAARTTREHANLMKQEAMREIEATQQAKAMTSAIKAGELKTKEEIEHVKANIANINTDTRVKAAQEEVENARVFDIMASTAERAARATRDESQAELNRRHSAYSDSQKANLDQHTYYDSLTRFGRETERDIDRSAYGRGLRWASRSGAGSSSALAAIGAMSSARGLGSAIGRMFKKRK